MRNLLLASVVAASLAFALVWQFGNRSVDLSCEDCGKVSAPVAAEASYNGSATVATCTLMVSGSVVYVPCTPSVASSSVTITPRRPSVATSMVLMPTPEGYGR